MREGLPKDASLHEILEPVFSRISRKLLGRDRPATDRARKYETARRKIEAFFGRDMPAEVLDHPAPWREFVRQAGKTLSAKSKRVFVQDLNSILSELYDSNILSRPIRMTPVKRKFASSQGFQVEKVLHFTSEDVLAVWSFISDSRFRSAGHAPVEHGTMLVLFATVLCSFTPVRHLRHLTVSGIRGDLIFIGDLICSVLLEPARSLLLRSVIDGGLEPSAMPFSGITEASFTRWLSKQCREAGTPLISADELYRYARFALVVNGVPGYRVACLGAKNAFSPFFHPGEEL